MHVGSYAKRAQDIGVILLIFPGAFVVAGIAAFAPHSDWIWLGAGAYYGWLGTYAYYRTHRRG